MLFPLLRIILLFLSIRGQNWAQSGDEEASSRIRKWLPLPSLYNKNRIFLCVFTCHSSLGRRMALLWHSHWLRASPLCDWVEVTGEVWRHMDMETPGRLGALRSPPRTSSPCPCLSLPPPPRVLSLLPTLLSILPPLKLTHRTFLVIQEMRIHLLMQETWVRSLVWEDSTCCGSAKPVNHKYWACAVEPRSHGAYMYVLEPACPRSRAPPLQCEAYILQLESNPLWTQIEKARMQNKDPAPSKVNKWIKKNWSTPIGDSPSSPKPGFAGS